MGLPFVIVEGPILVVDEQGNIVRVYKPTNGPNRISALSGLVGLNADGSEQTLVGAAGDRLKVEVVLAPGGNIIPTLGTGLKYEDMNSSNGGINRGTSVGSTFTTLYNKTGDGILLGFLVTLEKPDENWFLRLILDGVDVFGATGVSLQDLRDKDIYGYNSDPGKPLPEWIGFDIRENTLRYEGPNNLPLRYLSSVEIQLRKTGGAKKFRAGLVTRTG